MRRMWENVEKPDHFIIEKFEMLNSEEFFVKNHLDDYSVPWTFYVQLS